MVDARRQRRKITRNEAGAKSILSKPRSVQKAISYQSEEQVRRLQRETAQRYESEIRKTFSSKAEARDYERRLIERFRRIYGEDALPGNKSYH